MTKFLSNKLYIRILAFSLIVTGSLALSLTNAGAKPKYMKMLNADPYLRVAYRDQCNVCHISRVGGGERTYFGDAFDENGRKVTSKLRETYSQYFQPGH